VKTFVKRGKKLGPNNPFLPPQINYYFEDNQDVRSQSFPRSPIGPQLERG